MQQMIDKRIQNGDYAKAEDKTLQNSKYFQDFLYRSLKYEKDNDILPSLKSTNTKSTNCNIIYQWCKWYYSYIIKV